MKRISKYFISLLMFLSLTTSVEAVTLFNQEHDIIKGPAPYYFEDYKDDPTYDIYYNQVDHSLTRNLIDTAYVVGYQPSKFIPQFSGKTEYLDSKYPWNKTSNNAIVNLGVIDMFGNTALPPEVVLKKGQDAVPSYIRMNTSPNDTYGNSFNENCRFSGSSKEQCLEDHDALFENGLTNVFAIGTPTQRQLPLKTQKVLADKQSKQNLECYSENPPQDVECDNLYYLDENTTSEEASLTTLNVTYEEYLKNPEKYQDVFDQKIGDGGFVPFGVVVTKEGSEENTKNFLSIISNLFSKEEEFVPIVAIGWIPTIRGTAKNTKTLRNTLLPVSLQEEQDQELESLLNRSIDWTDVTNIRQAFIKKAVETTPHTYAPYEPSNLQFTGASIEAKTENPDPGISLEFLFGLLPKKQQQAKDTSFEKYKTTIIFPRHLIERADYLEKLSGTLFPKSLTNFPESYQEILLDSKFSNEEDSEIAYTKTTTREVPCVDSEGVETGELCTVTSEEKLAEITYDHKIVKSGQIKESETKTRVYSANQLGLPRNHEGYFESVCIFPELEARIPGLASIIGTATSLFNISECPEQLQESTSSDVDMENVDLFVSEADTDALIIRLLQTDNGAFWKDWYPDQPVHHCLDSNTYSDTCKQHLFENSCNGQLCYQYIINAAENTVCWEKGPNFGKYLNPYYAVAIALNENGALVSDRPNAVDEHHFGCDEEGLAGYPLDIPSKTQCMTNTLQGRCGLPDKENLKIYGYKYDYVLEPLEFLYGSSK